MGYLFDKHKQAKTYALITYIFPRSAYFDLTTVQTEGGGERFDEVRWKLSLTGREKGIENILCTYFRIFGKIMQFLI